MDAWVGIVSHRISPSATSRDVYDRERACRETEHYRVHEAFGALTKAVEVQAGQDGDRRFRLHSKTMTAGLKA